MHFCVDDRVCSACTYVYTKQLSGVVSRCIYRAICGVNASALPILRSDFLTCASILCDQPYQESRRGRGSMLSQTVPVQRRVPASKGGPLLSGASTYHAGAIAIGSGGGVRGGGSSGSSFKSGAREEYLRKILQSRHPFPPHFHMLLFIDR